MYNQIFFTNVLRLMDERGMSKNDLARLADVSPSFLSDVTTDKGNPSLKTMQAIAEALETPLPSLLEITDLDPATLDLLSGGKAPRSLPNGLVRVAAVLTEYQAFRVRQWDEENRKRARDKPVDKAGKSSSGPKPGNSGN